MKKKSKRVGKKQTAAHPECDQDDTNAVADDGDDGDKAYTLLGLKNSVL